MDMRLTILWHIFWSRLRVGVVCWWDGIGAPLFPATLNSSGCCCYCRNKPSILQQCGMIYWFKHANVRHNATMASLSTTRTFIPLRISHSRNPIKPIIDALVDGVSRTQAYSCISIGMVPPGNIFFVGVGYAIDEGSEGFYIGGGSPFITSAVLIWRCIDGFSYYDLFQRCMWIFIGALDVSIDYYVYPFAWVVTCIQLYLQRHAKSVSRPINVPFNFAWQ